MLMRRGDLVLRYDLLGPAGAVPVLLLHSLAADAGMWAEQVPALLSAGYRLLIPDMRGHGGSGISGGPVNLPALAGDVLHLAEALDLGPFHQVGLSIGGMIGQAMAFDAPGRVLSGFWADTIGRSDPALQPARDARRAEITAAGSVAAIAGSTMTRWFSDSFRSIDPARWQQIHDTIAATSVEGYLACAAAISDFDHLSRLGGLSLPVTVVCGAGDPSTPPSANRELAGAVPGARYFEIPGTRHLPNVERPDRFNPLLLAHLAAATAARPHQR